VPRKISGYLRRRRNILLNILCSYARLKGEGTGGTVFLRWGEKKTKGSFRQGRRNCLCFYKRGDSCWKRTWEPREGKMVSFRLGRTQDFNRGKTY